MQANRSPQLTERIVLTLRWLLLVGLALALGWGNGVTSRSIVLTGILAAWNLALTVLLFTNIRLPYLPYISLGVDVVFSVLFTGLVTFWGLPFTWAGILPILTGAFIFGFQGGLFAAVGTILLEGIYLTIQIGNAEALSVMVRPSIGLVLVGVLAGIIAQGFHYFFDRRGAIQQAVKEQAEAVEHDRIKALYQITSTMTATLNYQKVLDMALDLTADVLTDPGKSILLVSVVLLFFEDELYVGTGRRLTPSDHKVTLPGKSGLIVECLRSGQPRTLTDPENDPEIQRLVAMRNCEVVYCYPLRSHQEMFGVLLFGHPEADFFDQQRIEILEIVGRQALVALQNASLYRDLEQEKERMMEIQEEARKQLARDLHDGPTQSVAAIAMRVNFARRLIDRDANAAGDELYKIEDLARRTTKEIRHMLFTLRPLVLETEGLVPALESMAQKMKDTYDQRVLIDAEKEVIDELELSKQGVAFYIAEEAVNNAHKHAEAETIWVRLKKFKTDVALLEIEDNGVGFNVGEIDLGYEKRGSLGMVNMRERTELVNGIFHLSSEVGKGTQIRVLIPVSNEAAERMKRGQF